MVICVQGGLIQAIYSVRADVPVAVIEIALPVARLTGADLEAIRHAAELTDGS